ncbi:MAG: hypothetical protein GIW95_06200 [Candidatus Eremiobacteraeota bacterium]|nr:hypothetical protein [Candidatus Eremiobacteraeota bacterium]
MSLSEPLDPRRQTFSELRGALDRRWADASLERFTLAAEAVVPTGLEAVDAALSGGFPRGTIATLEGPAGSGRSALLARLLAGATAGGGLGALVESPAGPEGALYPPALAAAGVDLARLLIVPAADPAGVARSADILLRSAAFRVVAIPSVRVTAAVWTRLASLTHRAGSVLVALGDASDELRYFASLRVRLRATGVRWAGSGGLFGTFAESAFEATVLKHKRAASGKHAAFACGTFDDHGPPLASVREPTTFTEPSLRRTSSPRILAV